MDYKDSLLLPKTDFPMRGNLTQKEKIRYKSWDTNNIYQKMKNNRKDCPSFTLHDGPPYANGNIHIGHALNKILKDFIVKYHYFDGKSVRFTPGWDCHGLPIEQQVEKKLGRAKKESLAKTKIRELCKEHAKKFISIQKEEFKSLGIIADWDNPYLTMDYKFEANIYRELCNIADKSLLIQRSKPIYWSWAAKTALAEAEVEYQDRVSPSIYVAFKLDDKVKDKINCNNASLLIWTTTPWTLPANSAISLNPNERYIIDTDGYIVAKKLFNLLKKKGVLKGDINKEIEPKLLENSSAINPLNNNTSLIVLGEHVSMEAGTGVVHTAPGHGEDDYKIGLKYNLKVIMPVDDSGNFDKTIIEQKLLPEEFLGVNVFEANEKILKLLKESLVYKEEITHSYPHCWRTHKPVIFRATKQWFIAIDEKYGDNKNTLRQNSIKAIDKISFYPALGKNRLLAMIEDRPDWCISRQRDWGVPIAFFIDKKTGKPIYDKKVLNYIAMIFDNMGCDAWYKLEIKDLLYPGSGYKPEDLEKSNDILDVWFDSGSTQFAVLKSREYDAGSFPADLYLEGSDQHRGWFQSSLLVSLASNEKAPYKTILTHGFTMDKNGEKMSKSKGNVIVPSDITKELGSEILRLWVATSDYQNDQKISPNIIKQVSEQYRKIRNTFRFLFANIGDLEEIIKLDNLTTIDRWILNRAKIVFKDIDNSFREYNFSKGFQKLNGFITSTLSGIYLDVSKDLLYCNSKDDINRHSARSTMAIIAKSLMGLLAPFLTYTMDELMDYAPRCIKLDNKDIFDIVKSDIVDVDSTIDHDYFVEARERFFEHIDILKKEKKITNTLQLDIFTDSSKFLQIKSVEAEDWFTVSSLKKLDDKSDMLFEFDIKGDIFVIKSSNKNRCPRCWKHKLTDNKELCSRCKSVIDG